MDPAGWNESEMFLSDDEEHHLLDVLRAGEGEKVVVFDGHGREADAQLAMRGAGGGPGKGKTAGPRAVLRVLRILPAAGPAAEITLIQALPKGARMDLIVEQATELGVRAVLPLITARVIVRLSPAQRIERRARWQRVALSAAKQCQAVRIPDILPVTEVRDLRRFSRFDFFAVGALTESARPLHAVLDEQRSRLPRRIGLMVGPEGDLAPDELQAAIGLGAVPVSFGPWVLRVETAAVYGISVLAYELAGYG